MVIFHSYVTLPEGKSINKWFMYQSSVNGELRERGHFGNFEGNIMCADLIGTPCLFNIAMV